MGRLIAICGVLGTFAGVPISYYLSEYPAGNFSFGEYMGILGYNLTHFFKIDFSYGVPPIVFAVLYSIICTALFVFLGKKKSPLSKENDPEKQEAQ